MGLLLFASIATQITDQLWNDAFVATEYFGYFTIQSSLMNVVVLIVGGSLALRRSLDPGLLTAVRMSVLTYAVVTGVVYNALLRNVVSDGFSGIAWPNEVLHVWAPIFIALDWVLSPGRPALAWKRLGLALVYPLAWVAYAVARGNLTGFHTYPFLDPAQPGGYVAVALYVLGIAAFITGLAAAAIAMSRLRPRILTTEPEPEPAA
ncbi:MAG TPA: Pr6Pr family membrane protein [Cryobacterium sp.]|nr:Pr6Pr family membrane protein [Cryobacterium sp.]